MRALLTSVGNDRSPLTISTPALSVTFVCSSSTPGKAITIMSASLVSKMSHGASQQGVAVEAIGAIHRFASLRPH